MRDLILAIILGGSMAFSLGKKDQINTTTAGELDAVAGGYDKRPRTTLATANGTSTVPAAFIDVFSKRDGDCDNGVNGCSSYQCDRCGSCCKGGTCAENFGNCCEADYHCSYGFSCCTTFSGCCYEDTSFCCQSSPTGCCVKGTQCTPNGCVGEPEFVLASVTTTTTLTTFAYFTSTVHQTEVSTRLDRTTKLVTHTVTSDHVSVATVTKYTTSTKTTTSTQSTASTDSASKTKRSVTSHLIPAPPVPTPPTAHGFEALRRRLEDVGIVRKRAVTSYVYTFAFEWESATRTIIETDSVAAAGVVSSLSTAFSTITSTFFRDAKSTATVQSTVVVTSTHIVTPTTPAAATSSTTESRSSQSKSKPNSKSTSTATHTTSTTSDTTTSTSREQKATTHSNPSSVASDTASKTVSTISTFTSTSLSSTSTSPNTTTSSTSTSTSTSSSAGAGGGFNLSLGAKAGIGVGAGAAGLALLGFMVIFTIGKRRQANSSHQRNLSLTLLKANESSNRNDDWTFLLPPPPPPVRLSSQQRSRSYAERAASLARSMEDININNKVQDDEREVVEPLPLPSPGFSYNNGSCSDIT